MLGQNRKEDSVNNAESLGSPDSINACNENLAVNEIIADKSVRYKSSKTGNQHGDRIVSNAVETAVLQQDPLSICDTVTNSFQYEQSNPAIIMEHMETNEAPFEKVHVVRMNKNSEHGTKCDICELRFANDNDLNRHVKIHF